MSIGSLAEVAVARDRAQPGTRTPSSKRRAVTGDEPGPEQTAGDALTSAIPSETLAAYTGFIGIFVASGGQDAITGYLPLRWWSYIAFLIITLLAVVVTYRVKTSAVGSSKKRALPVLEVLTALVAAGAWGLVMPGSALSAQLSGTTGTVTITAITFGGSALLAVLSLPLTKGNSTPPSDAPPATVRTPSP